MPGEEAWLVGEQRASGERKYYLSNLPAEADPRALAATIKARWVCEQGHRQMTEELGLDHFEGRSWHGLHRRAPMTMIAYAFLQHRRLSTAAGEKKRHPRPAPANTSRRATGRHRPPRTPNTRAMSPPPKAPPLAPHMKPPK
jgi:SRSO17 transposase